MRARSADRVATKKKTKTADKSETDLLSLLMSQVLLRGVNIVWIPYEMQKNVKEETLAF